MPRQSAILVVDVGHPPRSPEVVEEELLQACTQIRNSRTLRLVKVIHGYGSSGGGGATREVVRNWAFVHRHRIILAINGEDYTLFSPSVQRMRLEVGNFADPDLGRLNPGITVLWIK